MPIRKVAKVKDCVLLLGFVAALAGVVSCPTSFDMFGEYITPLGSEWGIVIGLCISTACERMRYKG